jgi:hypothetical protein
MSSLRELAEKFRRDGSGVVHDEWDGGWNSGHKACAQQLEFALANLWQPIDTAPKDGTDIIVGYDCGSVWIVHVAWWRQLEDWMRHDPEWSDDDVAWWSYTNNPVTQERLDGHRTPTHWMPLPEPPTEDAP